MSTFKGPVPELANVLIDNFLFHESHTCFFLSHCHADHMAGLDQLLSKKDGNFNYYLYCSPISRLILLNKYEIQDESLIKEMTSTEIVTVPENENSPCYEMTVTPIPAGHCPGSIMFLFETVNKTILYTGDFRIVADDVKKFKQFHSKTQIKSIDKLYLDTTFLNEVYWHFPLRSEVVLELVTLIENWTCKSLNHHVILETSATYGYEFVFIELAKKLKCKIHVKDSLFNFFWNIPEVGFALTKDCNETKIHSHGIGTKKCTPCEAETLLKIRLSAQWYKCPKDSTEKVPIWKELSKKRLVVCFSTHCSCSELVNFLHYLKPKCIVPCATAVGSSEEDTNAYIQELVYSWTVFPKQSQTLVEVDLPLKRDYKFKIKFPFFEKGDEFFEEKKKRTEINAVNGDNELGCSKHFI